MILKYQVNINVKVIKEENRGNMFWDDLIFEDKGFNEEKKIYEAKIISVSEDELDDFLIDIVLNKKNLLELTKVNDLDSNLENILSFFADENADDFSEKTLDEIKEYVSKKLSGTTSKAYYHFLAEALLGLIFNKHLGFGWTDALIDLKPGLKNSKHGVDACLYNHDKNEIALGEAKFYKNFSSAMNTILKNFTLSEGKIESFLSQLKLNLDTKKILTNILEIPKSNIRSLTYKDMSKFNFHLFGFCLHNSQNTYQYGNLKEDLLKIGEQNKLETNKKDFAFQNWSGKVILIHLPIKDKVDLISKFIQKACFYLKNLDEFNLENSNDYEKDNKENNISINKSHFINDSENILEDRKSILTSLDNNQEVSNLQKIFYGLTPYIKWDDFTSKEQSWIENRFYLNQKSNVISHLNSKDKSPLFFFPEQQTIFNLLKENDKILLAAPTSFGKTLLIKELIFTEKPNLVAFIVPTNSLAMELENSFKKNENFNGEYEIFDSVKNIPDPKVAFSKKQIFIGTQEKFRKLNLKSASFDMLIIDEAYKLSEKIDTTRNYILSKVLLDSLSGKSKKIILLSPNAKFNGFKEYGFEIIQTKFNAVDRSFEIIKKEDFFLRIELLIKENEKTILFCNSPSRILKLYDNFENQNKNDKEINKLITHINNNFHEDWIVSKYLKKSILVHHGKIPKYLQRKILNLFNNNDNFNLLIGTNSISEGINTPAKNIFIDPEYKFKSENSKKMLIKNTIGRAGRLGKYPIGKIFSVEKIENNDEIEINLAISDSESFEEVDEKNQNTKIEKLCNENNIPSSEIIKEILKQNNWSATKFSAFLESIKIKRSNKSSNSIIDIYDDFAKKLNLENTYLNHKKFYLSAVLNSYYETPNKKIQLDSFKERIKFFKYSAKEFYEKQKIKYNEPSNSEIIDNLMNMKFSNIEYKYLPLANVFFALNENNINLEKGENVVEIFRNFNSLYNQSITRLTDINETEKTILTKLSDEGLPTRRIFVGEKGKKILKEISGKLNKRYSIYDIFNAIKHLAKFSEIDKKFYIDLVNEYID